MLEKICENVEAEQHVTCGQVRKRLYNSADVNLALDENFTTVKTGKMSSSWNESFFSFQLVLTSHMADFTLVQNSPQSKNLVLNRPLVKNWNVLNLT